MEFLVAVLFTTALMIAFVGLQSWLRVPRYRVEREDLRELVEEAIAGQARVERWDLLTGLLARHDNRLCEWQQRCRAIADEHMLPAEKAAGLTLCRFSDRGIEALRRVRLEMDHAADRATRRDF